MFSPTFSSCVLFLYFGLSPCLARDTITFLNPIHSSGGPLIVSATGKFALGFFTPNNGSSLRNQYVGIWYHNGSEPKTVVWVANRDNPVSNSTTFGIGEDGNIVLSGTSSSPIPISNLPGISSPSTRSLKLLDSGNLVLSDVSTSGVVWQSFLHPTDTFLAGMEMSKELVLTSWRSQLDATTGSFVFRKDEDRYNQYIITQDGLPYWKSGLYLSEKFISIDEIPPLMSSMLQNISDDKRKKAMSSNVTNQTRNKDNNNIITRLVMGFDGELRFFRRHNAQTDEWILMWSEPRDRCSKFDACGMFSTCNNKNRVPCQCLPGFRPQSLENWDKGDFSEGCIRKYPVCGQHGSNDFLKLSNMKVPKPAYVLGVNESECRKRCLDTCNCQAYSFAETEDYQRGRTTTSHYTCDIWTDDLKHVKESYAFGGRDLNLRVSPSEIGPLEKKKPPPYLIFLGVLTSMLFIFLVAFAWNLKRRRMLNRRENLELSLYNSERRVIDFINSQDFIEEDKKDIDVPNISLESILIATENFAEANKLGQGGFGPVYKGKLQRGQEIAIKRLSRGSGQGLEEFKNEVVLIAKLQHRNLVRLLGYCVKGYEKMLIYEYMPNKSLDSFIFDRSRCVLLNWEMRMEIIFGIARGLLYLHQDSRLRIVHRDLKTSNILLDDEMNPKISDFGLARIFGGKQIEANTERVVGTYGYMSPEYALDGFFSIKSDVFSFGVVLLETISGKRNTGFYQAEQPLSLLGYAWKLWRESRALDLAEQSLRGTCNENEFLRCVNVGLLCVQEDPSDRPTMSNVLFMLGSEAPSLPIPKQPAYVVRRSLSGSASSSSQQQSNAELSSSTLVEGR